MHRHQLPPRCRPVPRTQTAQAHQVVPASRHARAGRWAHLHGCRPTAAGALQQRSTREVALLCRRGSDARQAAKEAATAAAAVVTAPCEGWLGAGWYVGQRATMAMACAGVACGEAGGPAAARTNTCEDGGCNNSQRVGCRTDR
jgi:hypothetical protein